MARTVSTEPIYCPVQTYRQTRETPAEYCENEVKDYGDLCSEHDAEGRAEADYEDYREARLEDARADR